MAKTKCLWDLWYIQQLTILSLLFPEVMNSLRWCLGTRKHIFKWRFRSSTGSMWRTKPAYCWIFCDPCELCVKRVNCKTFGYLHLSLLFFNENILIFPIYLVFLLIVILCLGFAHFDGFSVFFFFILLPLEMRNTLISQVYCDRKT